MNGRVYDGRDVEADFDSLIHVLQDTPLYQTIKRKNPNTSSYEAMIVFVGILCETKGVLVVKSAVYPELDRNSQWQRGLRLCCEASDDEDLSYTRGPG